MVSVFIGIVLGMTISGPIGPSGSFAAMHASQQHMRAAISFAFGVCIAGAILTYATASMAALVDDFLKTQQLLIQIISAVLSAVFIVAGIVLWRKAAENPKPPKVHANFFAGFFMAMTNFADIASFLAIFVVLADYGIVVENQKDQTVLAANVFIGAAVAWMAMLLTVQRLGRRVSQRGFVIIRKGVGIVFVAAGTGLLMGLFV